MLLRQHAIKYMPIIYQDYASYTNLPLAGMIVVVWNQAILNFRNKSIENKTS